MKPIETRLVRFAVRISLELHNLFDAEDKKTQDRVHGPTGDFFDALIEIVLTRRDGFDFQRFLLELNEARVTDLHEQAKWLN